MCRSSPRQADGANGGTTISKLENTEADKSTERKDCHFSFGRVDTSVCLEENGNCRWRAHRVTMKIK